MYIINIEKKIMRILCQPRSDETNNRKEMLSTQNSRVQTTLQDMGKCSNIVIIRNKVILL